MRIEVGRSVFTFEMNGGGLTPDLSHDPVMN